MRDNPIRDFREKRLGWSRAKLGVRLNRSDKLIALYEAEAGDEILRELAKVAAEEGHSDYEAIFRGLMDGQSGTSTGMAEETYTPRSAEEANLVRGLLEIVRDPDPDSLAQAGLPQMIHQILAHRREFYRKK